MMENTGIVPTMPIGGNGAFENDSWIFLFAILALMWGGNGLFGGRGNAAVERCATVEDLNNSANFTRLEGQVMNNGNRIEQKADGIANGLCNLGYETSQNFGNLKYEMASNFNALGSKIDNCCCGIKQEILTNRYENALATSSINATTVAQTQKILDAIAQNKIETLQGKIQALELQNAVAGVVRYPTTMSYAYNANPFCGGYNGGCGCNGFNNI